MSDHYQDFVDATFPSHHRAKALMDRALADLYWRTNRAGYNHAQIRQLVNTVAHARNPIAVALTILQDAVTTPPRPEPRRRDAATHSPHRPCPDGHPDCVLCGCDGPVVHLVATPMPDWFKQAWRETLRSTVIPP